MSVLSFPLYNTLLDYCKTKNITSLSISEKNKFIKGLTKLNQDQIDLIFTIIRIFEIENENRTNSHLLEEIPYNGNIIKEKNGCSDISFDFDSFPILLQCMLLRFIELN